MERRPRVLIIEDNADLVAILGQLLGSEYDVAAAQAGDEGVRMALSFRPDIVILDMQLPVLGGREVGRRIKRSLDVPILVLTATAGRAEERAILESGCCDAYLAKPATLEAIRDSVSALLASAAGGRSADATGGARK